VASRCSIKGARPKNEDYHGSEIGEHYAFSFVCDGHGGPMTAQVLGSGFQAHLREKVDALPADASAEELVGCLRDAYHLALEEVNKAQGLGHQGSTLSALLFQYSSYRCATLQLGDCLCIVTNAKTGKLVPARIVYAIDDAPCGETPAMENCVTRAHGWELKAEVKRMNLSLDDTGSPMRVKASPNSKAWVGENRWEANLQNSHMMYLPQEPSRSVDTLQAYVQTCATRRAQNAAREEARVLLNLQRDPEFVVWQLPRSIPLAMFVCCDGFYSKNALPTPEAIALCIVDPEAYVRAQGVLQNTYVAFLDQEKPPSAFRDEYPEAGLLEVTRDFLLSYTNDTMWQEALIDSYAYISELRARCGGRVPSLLDDIHSAVSFATNVPTLLASDDNVSIELLRCTIAN